MTNSEKTCGNCRYWDGNKPKKDRILKPEGKEKLRDVYNCTAFPMYWEATKSGGEASNYFQVIKPEFSDARAFLNEPSEYFASLLTVASFGCVLHQPTQNN